MSKQTILDEIDVNYLKDLYKRLLGREFARYFNLFSIVRKDIHPSLDEPQWKAIKDKLDIEGKGECITNYFLYYREGSFTMMHTDSPLRVTRTAISLVDKSSDLEGGEIIVGRRVKRLVGEIHLPTDESIQRKKEPVPQMSSVMATSVIHQSVGETVWYPAQMKHGVTEVTKGFRLVLISWYKDNEKDQIHKETI